MDQHPAAFLSRFIDPIANRFQLRLEGVNTVVAHTLDVQDLDSALPLLDPEGAVAFALVVLRVGAHSGAGGRGRGDVAVAVDVHVVRGRHQRALADRDDVGDPKSM